MTSGAGVSAIRHSDMVEYLRQAGVVEINRRVEHRRVPGLQMVQDDACRHDAIKAAYKDGVLEVTIAKRPESKAARVEVAYN